MLFPLTTGLFVAIPEIQFLISKATFTSNMYKSWETEKKENILLLLPRSSEIGTCQGTASSCFESNWRSRNQEASSLELRGVGEKPLIFSSLPSFLLEIGFPPIRSGCDATDSCQVWIIGPPMSFHWRYLHSPQTAVEKLIFNVKWSGISEEIYFSRW